MTFRPSCWQLGNIEEHPEGVVRTRAAKGAAVKC
jgi:hypothetical protein